MKVGKQNTEQDKALLMNSNESETDNTIVKMHTRYRSVVSSLTIRSLHAKREWKVKHCKVTTTENSAI